jgi:2-oxo-4-hydroxy-4-carboxy--5-ureidoimidazoline (OHCU) decarboxylase
MAAIAQQSSEESAARRFWREKMAAHPNVAGGLAVAGEVAGFFLNGHFLVRLGQWVIRVSGSIAETALLFAVLWISGTSIAPGLVELFMSEKTMQSFVSVALIALALIPEIILANAIVRALGHIHTATQQKSPVSWAWAVLFTLPTALFLGLTGYTLNALVQSGGNVVQASAGLVGLRCFAGWAYGLLEMVYAGIGRRTLNQAQPTITPAHPPPVQNDYQEIARQLLPLIAQEVRQALPDTTGMGEQLQQLRVNLEDVTTLLLPPSATKSETSPSTPGNSAEYRSLQDLETEDEPFVDTREQHVVHAANERPQARITQKLSTTRAKSTAKMSTTNARVTARQKALQLLKKHPEMNATTLAKKAGITRQYASKILAEQAGRGEEGKVSS